MNDDVELLEEDKKESQLIEEKIEIVEHQESKYDDLKPRTEMADMTKEEQKEIKEHVLAEEKKVQEELENNKMSKSSNSLIIIILLVLILIVGLYILLWPRIKPKMTKQQEVKNINLMIEIKI